MANLTHDEIDAAETTLLAPSDSLFNVARLIRARDERPPEFFRIDESGPAIAAPRILARLRARRPARDPRAECVAIATHWDFPRSR